MLEKEYDEACRLNGYLFKTCKDFKTNMWNLLRERNFQIGKETYKQVLRSFHTYGEYEINHKCHCEFYNFCSCVCGTKNCIEYFNNESIE